MLNPVLRREATTLMRTWRTLTLIAIYTLCLAAVALVSLLSISTNTYSGFEPISTVTIYIALASFQAALIFLFVPALTAGSISGERERQTLDLMLVTKTTTLSIVLGKLMASLLVVVLMIIASLPVFGIVMYFDSVSAFDLVLTAAFSIITAGMVGGVSILMSSVFKKTVVSVAVTYLVLIIAVFGSFFALIIYDILSSLLGWTMTIHPIAAFSLASTNPIMGMISVFDTQQGYTNIESFVRSVSYGGWTSVLNDIPSIPLWVFNMIFNVLIIVVCCRIASGIIKPSAVSRTKKKRK